MYTDNIEYNFYILFFFLKYFKLVRYFLQNKFWILIYIFY
jgi:hypothetical protein